MKEEITLPKKLISLEQNNTQALRGYSVHATEQLNGIACPWCGTELLDSNPNVTLTSMPPQKATKCSNLECNYKGYRFV